MKTHFLQVACALPVSFLDYRKTDLWTCGALAYEIFGAENPFYRFSDGRRLNSRSYKNEDLPDLPGSINFYYLVRVAFFMQCSRFLKCVYMILNFEYLKMFVASTNGNGCISLGEVPKYLNGLVKMMLARDPSKVHSNII